MKKTVCIIDDEFRARERVRNLLKDETDFSIIGEADNGSDAVELIDRVTPELFFRAHRKSLVNIKKVDRMVPWGRSRYVLRFSDDEKVHLSKEKTQKFKRLIGLN